MLLPKLGGRTRIARSRSRPGGPHNGGTAVCSDDPSAADRGTSHALATGGLSSALDMAGPPDPSLAALCARSPIEAARDLLGTTLLVEGVGGVVVETEAYDRTDPASHSFAGRTARNGAMFGPPAHVYVYRSYGIHWCLNIVCGSEPGGAVLVRALEPTVGLDSMRTRRGVERPALLCSGPGRLCQALGVTGALDGASLGRPPFAWRPRTGPVDVVVGPRIGISRGADRPWRFGLRASPFLSRPFKGAASP